MSEESDHDEIKVASNINFDSHAKNLKGLPSDKAIFGQSDKLRKSTISKISNSKSKD